MMKKKIQGKQMWENVHKLPSKVLHFNSFFSPLGHSLREQVSRLDWLQ